MKLSKTTLLVPIGLLATALCVSAYTLKMGTASAQDSHITIEVNEAAMPSSFDAQLNAGKVVAMTAIFPNGKKLPLKQVTKPACSNWSCPAGSHLTCWEDEELLMSMCACVGNQRPSAVVSLGK